MLFMVIEYFKVGAHEAIRERFVRDGRMLPEGAVYHASWIDAAGAQCFQVMEAADLGVFEGWTQRWTDLIDFKIVPVQSSQEYWAGKSHGQ
jgi:hypothetical protein